MRERDAHLVGEYVECLRAFGSDDSDPLIQLGMTFLLRAQDPATHRWDVGGDAYTSYHATMVACQALLVHTHRGYGPGLPSCVAVLEKWHAAERPDDVRENPDIALRKRVDDKARKPPKKEASEEKPASPRPQKPAAEPKKRPASPDKSAKPPPQKKKKKVPQKLSKEDIAAVEAKIQEAVAGQAWPVASKLLKNLAESDVSVELLKTTTVGKTVAALKKAADAKLVMAAKGLVARWKQMVRDADAASSS